MAVSRRNLPEGCAHHGDHGSQYVSLFLSKTMRENGIRPSMRSISSPWDNAAMESLMGIVKSEYVHARTYATREEAALDLFGCIEVVYSRVKMHSVLGYLSPAKFEEAIWPKEESHPRGGVKGVNGRRILRNVATPPNAEGPYRRGKTSSVQL